GVGLFLRHGDGDEDYFRVASPDVVAMTENEAAFALPAPADSSGEPVAGDPAGALLRAAPVSDAERWVTRADEQVRRGRLGAPAGDNARDSLLAAQRSDASYLGLAAAVDRFVDASADAAARAIRDKDDKLAAERVRDAMKVADATQRVGSGAVDKLHASVMQALLARIAASAAAFVQAGAQQVLESARALGVSRADLEKLSARANDIPAPGEPL